jgi:hypothetical protein
VIAAAALARTTWVGRHHLRLGLAFQLTEKVGWFIVSVGVILGAIFASILALIVVGGLGSMIASTLWEHGLPQSPVDRFVFRILAACFGVSAFVAPLAAGIWFLWTTRPQ